jgi:hypothetical protein
MRRQRKRLPSEATRGFNRVDFYDSIEVMNEVDAAMDAVELQAKERFVDGFADLVVSKGYKARIMRGPHRGKTWQSRGREMFGKERFDAAMLRAIERKRGAWCETADLFA